MERMLVVVFNDESKAYEGSRALKQLDKEGSISIHAESIIGKNADGTVALKQSKDEFPVRTVGGTAIGSIIGLLGGPAGLAIGATAGALAGSFADLNVAGVDGEYIDDVAAALIPGKCAVIADVSEEWITPVDTSMEELGGVVIRTDRKGIEADQKARENAELRAEMDQLKAEQARTHADRKGKIQAKIDELKAKHEGSLDAAQKRSAQNRIETEAKVAALQKKADQAQGDIKATLEARIKQLREAYDQSEAKTRALLASQSAAAGASAKK
jgi:uncharacterized membrane protein